MTQIVHPTVIEPRGLDLFKPISNLIKSDRYVGLAPNQVRVYYKNYVNDFKRALSPLQPREMSIREAINDQLTPGS